TPPSSFRAKRSNPASFRGCSLDCFVAARLAMTVESIILQETLDIIEFDLRARGVGKAAAELFEDAPHLLHVHLARNHLGQLVILMRAQRPPQRIRTIGARLLAAHAVARALAIAIALLHRFRKLLGALAKRLECLALRIHRAVGIAFAELAAGIAHGTV